MLAAIGDRTQSHGQRKGATTGLKVTLSRGRKIVGVLDAFVKTALKDDPALLADWDVIKRVRIIPTRPTAEEPAVNPAPEAPKAA
jgi:hypothetical protein